MQVKELITSLGGPAAVGRRVGVRSQAVSLWVANGQVPLDRVPALLRMAAELSVPVNAEDLRPDVDWAAVCCCKAAV